MESSEQTNSSSSSSSNLQLSTKKTPSVIVIGAGFAGLSAARALHDASFHVTLLESRDRYGGRVWTNNSLGFPVDMGASWLHGFCDENPLAPLIKRLELPLHRTSGDDSVLYDHDLESYALYDVDGTKVDQELVTKVGKIFDVILEETTEIRKKLSEDISIEKAISIVLEEQPHLRQEGVAHKVLQWYVCRMEGWFATDASNISLKYWDEEDLLSGGHYLMVSGYRLVLDELAEGLDIRLSHRVTKIDQRHHNEVKVTVEDGQIFVADAAVVAVPLGVLRSKSINFEPRLPASKETAIADLGVGIENKIALHFDKVFWPNVEFLGIVASTSYGCSYFLNLHKATGHKVLVYMPAGQLALDMDKLSEKDAANEAYIHLKKILPGASEPVGYLVSHWGTDINSLGSYSYDSVGKSHELYEQLRKPVDNIFFAGEATSQNYPGTVHGAFSTGLLAAKECIKNCGNLDLISCEESAAESVSLLISPE